MIKQCEQKPILAIYDVSGIQEYIFATSRLRENVGASLIVGQVLKEQLPWVLEKMISGIKGEVITRWERAGCFQMKHDSNVQAEVIYNGGGSAVVAYRDKSLYDEVNAALAQSLIEKSYILILVTAYIETDFQDYGADRKELDRKLEVIKARMLRQRPMGCLPIVEQEGLTGWPITQVYNREYLSTVQALKRQAADSSKNNSDRYNNLLPPDAEFAVEMDDLISCKEEDSFVAIVHIDGNGMGQALQQKLGEFCDYEQSVKRMRELSRNISDVFHDVFSEMVNEIYQCISDDTKKLSFDPVKRDNKFILPIRPLILDGDDVTFICNGRLGVPLAALFLRRLAITENKLLPLSACAGVALVHSHFPFNIAYEIAESCCSNAKKKRLEMKDKHGYIDFRFGHSAHKSETEDHFLRRPYQIAPHADFEHELSFDRLNALMANLPGANAAAQEGAWPRLRLKKLYEAYRLGSQQVKSLLQEFASRGYELSSLIGQPFADGYKGYEETPLYDALELMDLYERNVFESSLNYEGDEYGCEADG